jgi:hypothetical protein
LTVKKFLEAQELDKTPTTKIIDIVRIRGLMDIMNLSSFKFIYSENVAFCKILNKLGSSIKKTGLTEEV